MGSLDDAISKAVSGRQPLLFTQTAEEQRVAAALRRLAADSSVPARAVVEWGCVSGLGGAGGDTCDPVAALAAIGKADAPAFYLMKDLSEFFGRPDVIRSLRDLYDILTRDSGRFVVMVSSQLSLPPSLDKQVCLVDVPPPSTEELRETVAAVEAQYDDAAIPDAFRSEMALALKGLTLNEVGHIMHRVLSRGALARNEMLEEIFREKEAIVRRSGFLEFIPPRCELAQVGGLENLKDWLVKRRGVFNQKTVDSGMPVPKGILIMGVSGCGKSLCAKVVSSLWGVPLFRLDMNLVFSGMYGSPEAAFHHALKTVESVAPAVMWIDEIENGLGVSEKFGADQNHVFSAFLTWMQEKPPLVFVAATANQIHLLPAEIIRKGRFDQVFFCDLPEAEERESILRIHIESNGGSPDDFDIKYLVIATDGWNGAEIEQAVVSARIDAFGEDRPFNTDDINRHTRAMVPLSETMAEQIKAIRNWAWGRATKASRGKKPGQRTQGR